MRTQYGIIISVIAGAIVGLLIKNLAFNPVLIPYAIIAIALVGVLIGCYVDYTANYDLRNDEPVLAKSIVMNVLGLIGGVAITIALIVFGGI